MNKLINNTCWICGNPANSREHKIKKSDLTRRYGNIPFHKIGGMLHLNDGQISQVQGKSSKILSYEPVICSNCNNNKSQQWDKAYEQFERWIFDNSSSIFQCRLVQFKYVFKHEYYTSKCQFLYKYFVKAFGCRLASANYTVPIDLVSLLDKPFFLSKLKLSFSIHKTLFALLPEDRDNFLGIGQLIRIDSLSKGIMERYIWHIDIGWLRVWFFYDLDIPSSLGSPWSADIDDINIGEFETASLDELIACARNDNAPALSHFESLKAKGGIFIE